MKCNNCMNYLFSLAKRIKDSHAEILSNHETISFSNTQKYFHFHSNFRNYSNISHSHQSSCRPLDAQTNPNCFFVKKNSRVDTLF